MSAKGRASLVKVFASASYKTWAAASPQDAAKVQKAFNGKPHSTPSSRFGQGLVGLCEENPPLAPLPDLTSMPAPFDGRGMTLLEPSGGVEDMGAVQAAGFTYVLLNIAFERGGSWATVRSRCAARNIEVVPWRRVYAPADSAQIENTASDWGCRAVAHNLETEAATTYPPINLGSYVKQFQPRVRAVITEPWAQNNAGWGALADWVGMPEAFLNADPRYLPADLVAHLVAEGIPRCLPLFGWGAWSDAPTYVSPAQYLQVWPSPRPYSVYFGDSREPQYGEWKR